MELSGTEIFIETLTNHNVDTISGYPGACVISILDKLFDHKEIKQIFTRHEQGALYAAYGYALLSNKPGVIIVTSGPGATNTVTGIADAFYNQIPLIVITGQVSSELIGTDAFQEVDILSITAPITKWNYQIRNAGEMQDAVEKAFAIATADAPGPVLLDITKDAQIGKAEYIPNHTQPTYDNLPINKLVYPYTFPENKFYTDILMSLRDTEKDIVLVVDKIPNDFYIAEFFGSNRVIKSGVFGVPGMGLPTAIGAQCATCNKTICLVTGALEFQATAKELGVIKQLGMEVKIIVLDEAIASRHRIKNPDFVRLAGAYDMAGCKIDRNNDLPGAIQAMLNYTGSYLLQIIT